MTGTATTAADLLQSYEYRALIECWQRDRRCPLCLPDYLREYGLEKQAEVAEWCVHYKDRPEWENEEQLSGPAPHLFSGGWGWDMKDSQTADEIDTDQYLAKFKTVHHETFIESVTYLLDNYTPVELK